MLEPANPAVIIGLGGSGQWILTYLKKNLQDSYGGRLPDTVRLLSFDTLDKDVSNDDTINVSGVQLSDSEYQFIGGNIEQLCREIRDRNRHPHIGSWLQAKYYLGSNARGAFDISKGAGQQRPFGRMAIFYDLQKSAEHQLVNLIQKAITEVVAANKKQAAVEIYIVASLAGGTGAGMFIDIAHLARWFAKRSITAGNFYVRGFLALQNVFNSVIRVDQFKANAFASMRELDRFMQVFDHQYPIVYNETNPVLKTVYGGQLGKLFDSCYLIDANRENLPLDGVQPKYGVYPSIADGITMMLDAKAGDAYAQHHLNVNARIAENQSLKKQSFYSSMGTYSMILPVEDMLESMAYRFSIELLAQYLTSAQTLNNEQSIIIYQGDPKKEVGDFLRMTQSKSGMQSTNFIQRVPNTLENRNINDALYRKEIAEQDANELTTWLMPPDSDPLVEQASREVIDTLETRLITKVAPTHEYGDDHIVGADRITRGVREFKDEYLGRDIGGVRQGGRYRLGLERFVQIHRDRYHQLLHEYVLGLLNGVNQRNPLYQEQRRGKLGYVQEFLRVLGTYFTELSSFFGEIKRFREKQDYLRELQEQANLARANMDNHKADKGIIATFIKGAGKAAKSQDAYLDSEQELIDVMVVDLLFEHLRATADSLRVVTEEVKTTVDAWVATLVQGMTGAFSDLGLYKTLLTSQRRHENNREEKKQIKVHEYVTDKKFEDELYKSYTAGKFDEALSRLEWSIDPSAPTFNLTLTGTHLLGNNTVATRTATEKNVTFFLSMAREYVAQVRQLSIARRLSDLLGAAKLASTLLQRCSPMIRYDPAKQGAQEAYNFIFINNGGQDSFFSDLGSDMRTRGASARSNQLLELTNRYSCTIMSTIDVIASIGITPYIEAAKSYDQHAGDVSLLHIFPAEVNAVQYEQKLPNIREERRRFSATITTMLEDKKVVEDFILAYIYGIIRLEAVQRESRYVVQLAPLSRRRDIDTFNLTRPSARASLFQAMETFVFRQADIDDLSPKKIDMERVRQNLHDFEARKANNDPQELIDILDTAISDQIRDLRNNADQSLRDLGSLMHLVIEEIIHSMEDLLKRGVKMNSERIEPSLFALLQDDTVIGEFKELLTQLGFMVQDVGRDGLFCTNHHPIWQDISPLYIHLILERTLDIDEFKYLCTAAEHIYGHNLQDKTVAVLIDHAPKAGDLHQIFALNAQRGLTIVPLPRSLLMQAKIDQREKSMISEQFALYKGMKDLYSVPGAVSDILSFFGRSALINRLREQLLHGHSTIAYGIRKVGKSSLLQRLREECPWAVAMIDLEGHIYGLHEVYQEILKSWQVALQVLHPKKQGSLWTYNQDSITTAQDFRKAVLSLLDTLTRETNGDGLILFLDEVDMLIDEDEYISFASVLRSIAEHREYRGRFAVLMAGLSPTLNRKDRIHDKRNPFFNFIIEEPVRFLETSDIYAMVRSLGGQMGISYTDEALQFLASICGGHPFLTRQICSLAIRGQDRPCELSKSHIIQITTRYLRETRNYLSESLWAIDDDGPPLAEQHVLKSLATRQPQTEALLIDPQLPLIEQRALRIALDHLRDLSLIHEGDNGWHITIPLYCLWIRGYILGLTMEVEV